MFVLGFGVKAGLGELSRWSCTASIRVFKSDRLCDGRGGSEGLGGWGLGVQ